MKIKKIKQKEKKNPQDDISVYLNFFKRKEKKWQKR